MHSAARRGSCCLCVRAMHSAAAARRRFCTQPSAPQKPPGPAARRPARRDAHKHISNAQQRSTQPRKPAQQGGVDRQRGESCNRWAALQRRPRRTKQRRLPAASAMHGSLRATLAGGPAAPAFSAARPRPQHRMARPARATAASPSPSSPEVRAGLAAAGSWVRGARPASSGGGAASPHHGSGGGGARPATHTAACAYALLPRRSRLPKLSSPLPHPTAAAAGGRREHPAAAAGGRRHAALRPL